MAQRAGEVGGKWESDYELLYHLMSMHAHGAPGAILHPIFVQSSQTSEVREQDSTALVAYISMRVLMDDIRLLKRSGFISDTEEVEGIFSAALEEPR